jgi:ABC-type sugar transport system ATPase subunit
MQRSLSNESLMTEPSAPADDAARFMLTAQSLAKRYGAVTALSDVSFEARSGHIHAIVGENGAGKSTLVKILVGLVSRDAGTMVCDGTAFDFAGPADAAAAGVEVAFQESGLIANLTVAENLVLSREGRVVLSTRRRMIEARARQVLAEADAPLIDVRMPVGRLSLAARQIVEVVRAVSRKPKVLVLDEANSALSGADNRWFLETARKAAAGGALVLFITHRLREVREVANTFTILRGGQSVMSGTPGKVTNDEIIEAMVGIRVRELKPNTDTHGTRTQLQVRNLRPKGSVVDVSFDINEGEIVGLAGLEGNGQEQVILALGGAMRWDGSIKVAGQDYSARTPRRAIAGGVVLVPGDRQEQGLLGKWPIRDNITLSSMRKVCSPLGLVNGVRATAAASDMCLRLQLPHERLDAPASSLSGGNQQRVVLARVLLTDPKVILLYDGTRGVDVATRSNILRLLKELASSGMSVLFYSSDLSEYAQIAHRVLVMSSGRIVGATEGAVTEQEILRVAVESPRDARSHAPGVDNVSH